MPGPACFWCCSAVCMCLAVQPAPGACLAEPSVCGPLLRPIILKLLAAQVLLACTLPKLTLTTISVLNYLISWCALFYFCGACLQSCLGGLFCADSLFVMPSYDCCLPDDQLAACLAEGLIHIPSKCNACTVPATAKQFMLH